MKKRDYVVLSTVVRGHCATQREVAAQTGYSLGLVSASLKYLMEEGYLAEDYFLTPKTIEMFRRNSPRQAVILAAGPGKRMMPINSTPKALLTIGGESLIERLINQLHRTGIYNIAVVVGYQKEKFEYLTSLYSVELLENPRWAEGDSLHSLQCAAHLLDNCYVINGDVWCGESLFSRSEYSSWYAVRSYFDEKSILRVTREMELVGARQGGGNAMCGIAYLCSDDAAIVRENLTRLCADPACKRACWEAALIGHGNQLVGYANVISGMLVMPVNTYEDLRLLDSESKHLESRRMALISQLFGVSAGEITDIHPLSSGMTNHLMHFSCKGKEYLMRSPGEGTQKLVSRQKESAVYKALASTGMDISDKVIYLNPETGYKVTEFWSEARPCDPEDFDEVAACIPCPLPITTLPAAILTSCSAASTPAPRRSAFPTLIRCMIISSLSISRTAARRYASSTGSTPGSATPMWTLPCSVSTPTTIRSRSTAPLISILKAAAPTWSAKKSIATSLWRGCCGPTGANTRAAWA